MGSLGEAGGKEFGLNIPNPILIELKRLENLLRDKERELGAAQNEIKALKGSEFLKDKAVVVLSNDLRKVEQKLGNAEKQMEDKNLEIKKLIGEKKAAISAQFAAEATLRRIHASQKDDDSVSVGTLIAPLEAEIKMYKNEIAALQEDRKAVDRVMKSKELALVEAEKSLNDALERALMVENLQNQNLDLKRQVEICMEERKTLERELSKAKICANRVATVVANEWKDEGDKVMPVKQWLEERRFLQGEIQRLKDKLAISERSAKAEGQLKDKLKLRLRTVEEGFNQVSTTNSGQNFRFSSPNNVQRKRSGSQPRASLAASKLSVTQLTSSATGSADPSKTLQRSNNQRGKFISSENVVRKKLWASRSKFYDEIGKENIAKKINFDEHVNDSTQESKNSETETNEYHGNESQNTDSQQGCCDDIVSGFLYDRLQKEVILLRKLQEEKDEVLNAKEDDIKLLQRKVEALTKAMEVEAKNMRKVAAAREKEAQQKSEGSKQNNRTTHMVIRTFKPEVSTNSKT